MVFVIVRVHLYGCGKLAQVARATNAARIFLRLAQSGQEQSREDGDDCDDDEQLDQREGSSRFGRAERRMSAARHDLAFSDGAGIWAMGKAVKSGATGTSRPRTLKQPGQLLPNAARISSGVRFGTGQVRLLEC